jgi:hypothetical protein
LCHLCGRIFRFLFINFFICGFTFLIGSVAFVNVDFLLSEIMRDSVS